MQSEKRGQLIDIRQEPLILVSGSVVSAMALENKYGQMVLVTKETGRITEHKALASSPISMETFTRATGSTIKLMVEVCISMSTEPDMKVHGWMISSMATARSPGLMAQSTKASILRARSTVEVFTAGMTDPSITEIGKRIRSKALEHILGWMEGNIKANGLTTTWTESVCTHGKTEDSIAVNTRMIRNTDMESIHGPMVACTQATGAVGSSMDLVHTVFQHNQQSVDYGKKANASNGSMKVSRKRLG